MAMRAWLIVPKGGLGIDGVSWPGGVREITDSGWHKLLVDAGAEAITEREYEDAQAASSAGNEGDKEDKQKTTKVKIDGAAANGLKLADHDERHDEKQIVHPARRPRAKHRKQLKLKLSAESTESTKVGGDDAAGGAERGEG